MGSNPSARPHYPRIAQLVERLFEAQKAIRSIRIPRENVIAPPDVNSGRRGPAIRAASAILVMSKKSQIFNTLRVLC